MIQVEFNVVFILILFKIIYSSLYFGSKLIIYFFLEYKLVGFISHMGTSSMVGHYVCHLLKEGRWVIYNDEKVAVSENPPKDLGYIYMYQRFD